ncbi:NAD(P)-dependent oxidoreductase [Paracidobacterium acidisoli]|uniref:NAD(P)-dependent oxidoreductase n=1 Tax=Paracidobacterium acidisoli TaxID=2303751 RepID=A0A372IQN4_9BACT|nr:NAD(P)-dependent oxidoreductase [Paracidobacterium acidisoli]MBT9331565.1 NAD(P)-dependent oxidoreductase [Paracidobacterium acidisoli]
MSKLGFIGLGIMGGPMGLNLIKAGHEVAIWSHSKNKVAALAEKGGIACATPAEVAKHSECTFLCVGNTEMSREVILGQDGLIEGAAEGTLVVDCSTISPSAARRIAAKLAEKGVGFLDAPCTGSKAGAEGASLTFMVGGPKETFEKVRPWFETMGKLLYYCGGIGMGLHAKLSQNMILGSLLQAFNESLVLSTKAGVDPELMLDILNNSAARSGFISIKAPMVFARNFTTNFSVKWLEKDLELMLESAAELNVPAPLTAISKQLLQAAIAKGYGEDDICGSIRVLEDITGTTVAARPKE